MELHRAEFLGRSWLLLDEVCAGLGIQYPHLAVSVVPLEDRMQATLRRPGEPPRYVWWVSDAGAHTLGAAVAASRRPVGLRTGRRAPRG